MSVTDADAAYPIPRSRTERTHIHQPADAVRIPPTLTDSFTDARRPGTVIGSRTLSGVMRQGVDTEGTLSIDNGALRIQPLLRPGWGKAALTYGPYLREDGLLLAVNILNGHNTSQSEPLPESLPRRLQRWLRGPDVDPVTLRLWQWMRWPYKRLTPRRFMAWALSSPRLGRPPRIDENLALGWFFNAASSDPLSDGACFMMHAGGPNNGELWARIGEANHEVMAGVANIPMHYAVVLRKKGAAYYAAPDKAAIEQPADAMRLRPMAIDPWSDEPSLYAGLHQSVLGQIGFRIDTRVYEIHVEKPEALSHWYGTAHFADKLCGQGTLHGSSAEVGGSWLVSEGEFVRTSQGIRSTRASSTTLAQVAAPSGLIHLLFAGIQTPGGRVQLLWRYADAGNHWSLTLEPDRCSLDVVEGGARINVASVAGALPCATAHDISDNSLQVQDDGVLFSVCLNGRRLFDRAFEDSRLGGRSGIGIHVAQGLEISVHALEAHPRLAPLPLSAGGPIDRLQASRSIAVHDDFAGPAGDLAHRRPALGEPVWQRSVGKGHIRLTGEGSARVDATVERPAPGRIVYTVAWAVPDLAELEIGVVPPGTERGQSQRGRAGVVFWQDERNYIIVNTWLDDHYAGSSISSFFRLNGFEEIYDAVWTNVGRKVMYGVPYRLGAVFDGMNYAAYVDGEPVLYRALTDVYPKATALRIHRVGIVANWEWGTDTGTLFTHFTATG